MSNVFSKSTLEPIPQHEVANRLIQELQDIRKVSEESNEHLKRIRLYIAYFVWLFIGIPLALFIGFYFLGLLIDLLSNKPLT